MPRWPRKRSIIKWSGLTVCVLLLVGWIGTFWSVFGYTGRTVFVNLWGGCLEVSVCPGGVPSEGWFAEWHSFEGFWRPKVIHGSISGVRTTHCFIPLWIPLFAVGLVTILAWRCDRRFPPGHCRVCNYDLAANTTGLCPECGAETARPGRLPTRGA